MMILLFKKPDKGGDIAVLDKGTYVSKISNMFNNENTYKLSHIDDTIKVKEVADSFIFQL